MADHVLTFMGTAAGCGVPSFFCDCPACEEARLDPSLAKGDCGIMVRRAAPSEDADVPDADKPDPGCKVPTLVIDTPPDARHQLLREGVRCVDEVLFTHCHFDHIGGLGEYEYMVALARGGEKLPVYGSEDALAGIFQEFHYMDYAMDPHVIEPYRMHMFDGVRYTGLPVTHAPGTYGYLIETPDTRMFYASDTGRLPEQTADLVRGVDILAMDATFWKKNWNDKAHHSIQECIEEGLELDAGTIYLTHTCMHYDEPITHAELEEYISQYDGRVKIAMDGMSVEI